MIIDCKIKDWEESVLGIRVYDVMDIDSSSLPKSFSPESLFFIKININEVEKIQLLEELGFRISEFGVSYAATLSKLPMYEITNRVREATENDIPELHKISDLCFTISRFHKDAFLHEEDGQKLYRSWIENAVTRKYGDAVSVYEDGNKIYGFSSCRLYGDSNGSIDLTAVTLEGVSKFGDIGYELTKSDMNFFIKNKVKVVTSSTQLVNTGAISLFEKFNFNRIGTFVSMSRGA